MLTLEITKTEVKIIESFSFVRGTKGLDGTDIAQCRFTIDDYWTSNHFVKHLVFKKNQNCLTNPIVILLEDDKQITIPHEMFDESGSFRIGFYGIKNNTQLPTLWSDDIKVDYGTDTYGTAPKPPTPTVYDELLKLGQTTKEIAESVRADADAGKFNGKDGPKGSQGEKGDAGFSPSAKVEETTAGAKITITDEKGTTFANIKNGKDAENGVSKEEFNDSMAAVNQEIDQLTGEVSDVKIDIGNIQTEQILQNSAIQKNANDVLTKADTKYVRDNFANAIKQNISGAVVAADDVNPIEHNVKCTVENINLLNLTIDTEKPFIGLWKYFAKKGFVLKAGQSYSFYDTVKNGVQFAFKRIADDSTLGANLNEYTVTPAKDELVYLQIYKEGGFAENIEQTIMFVKDDKQIPYVANIPDLSTVKVTRQRADGTDSQVYIPSADGTVTGMTSLSPNMTILVDAEGVIVNAEYNVDTKEYFDKPLQPLTFTGAVTEIYDGTESKTINIPQGGSGGGTSDHNALSNRDMENQHPISAITGLQSTLNQKANSSSIPTTLPTTNKLTFSGAVTGEFDGSQPLNVEIPENELPAITADLEGAFLTVSSQLPKWVKIPNANGGSF